STRSAAPGPCFRRRPTASTGPALATPGAGSPKGTGKLRSDVMWVTRVRQLPDGEEMIWSEPQPSDREAFSRDPRRAVLEVRSDVLRAERAAASVWKQEEQNDARAEGLRTA